MRLFQTIAMIFFPDSGRRYLFDRWLRLLNEQTMLELRCMKGGAEWREINRRIEIIDGYRRSWR